VLILNDCCPSALGLKTIVSSVDSPSSIEIVCGVMLTSSAHDSKSDSENWKSLSSPLFVISVLTIRSVPISAAESRFGFTVGSGPRQDRMFNLVEKSLSRSSSEFSLYEVSFNSSSSSS